MNKSNWLGPAGIGALVLIAGPLAVHVVKADGAPETGALTYAGVLTDAAGSPLPSPQDIVITVWDSGIAGNETCAGSFPAAVLDDDGRFQVTMPDECAAAVSGNTDLWIEVAVGASTLERTKIGAVPYALEATNARSLGGLPAVAFQQRVDAAGCSSGSTISAIAEDGTVSCRPDADTTYLAGDGLSLNAGTFAVATPTTEPATNFPLTSAINGAVDHVTTQTYAFCALSYVRYPANATGTTHWCVVSRNGDGTWTLQAAGTDEVARCGMTCF